MLKRCSFKITDAEGMNEVLAKYDMVSNAGMAINEGIVNFSYDDGEPDSLAMVILGHKKALRNDLNLLEATLFTKRTMQFDIDKLEAHRSQKEVIENKKEWESAYNKMEQIVGAMVLTDGEIFRLNRDIECRRARVAELMVAE